MQNIELWTRDRDRKIAAAACATLIVAFAALIGAWIPTPEPLGESHGLNSLITSALLVFVWAAFRTVRPIRFSQKWIFAEVVAVPLIWVLLVVALALWFHHLSGVWEELEYLDRAS